MKIPEWKDAVFELEDLSIRFGFAVDALQLIADGLGHAYAPEAGNAVDTMARLFGGMQEETKALMERMLALNIKE